ncbi:hypothetical protein F2P56_012894 [Juglans regia]|uniref:Uncharacterized protein n=1 Tax=Juglans regia TaxID=51240 RepID=A0A833XPQ0_JUGRE|nr:hypothetical protein F2P56_012894 [Juglans regia]
MILLPEPNQSRAPANVSTFLNPRISAAAPLHHPQPSELLASILHCEPRLPPLPRDKRPKPPCSCSSNQSICFLHVVHHRSQSTHGTSATQVHHSSRAPSPFPSKPASIAPPKNRGPAKPSSRYPPDPVHAEPQPLHRNTSAWPLLSLTKPRVIHTHGRTTHELPCFPATKTESSVAPPQPTTETSILLSLCTIAQPRHLQFAAVSLYSLPVFFPSLTLCLPLGAPHTVPSLARRFLPLSAHPSGQPLSTASAHLAAIVAPSLDNFDATSGNQE